MISSSTPPPRRLRLFAGTVLLLCAVAFLTATSAEASVPASPVLTYGPDGPVEDIARLQGKIYLGGLFDHIGLQTGPGAALAIANGNADREMPAVSGGEGLVETVVADGSGGYYIGGDFTHVGGMPRRNIAHILPDKSVDPSFAPNANNRVRSLALSGTTLYVGGRFSGTSSIGGADRNRIAALDTSTGAATSWNPSANSTVRALAVSGSTVYAGGFFSSIGGASRSRIAALDATTGAATSWNPGANGTVWALAVSGSTVYAGGEFNGTNSIGGADRNRIAALDATTGNATSWNPNATGPVYALAVHGPTIYAGGSFNGANSIGGADRNYIAALDATTGNATSWNPDASDSVLALAVHGSTVFAGGLFTSIGGVERRHVAALDASTGQASGWNAHGPNGPVDGLAVSGSTIYAGGDFRLVNEVPRTNLAAIHASTGRPTPWSPDANGTVSVLAASGSTVYAGGLFHGTNSIGGADRDYLAALDATTGDATGWDPDANDSVRGLAVDGSTVYAGGQFNGTNSIGGADRNHIAALDATTGDATSWNPDANAAVVTIHPSGQTIYVGGIFQGADSIGGADRTAIAALDASTGLATDWNPGSDGTVLDFAVHGSTVYVGGFFNSIGGANRNYIAALDATTGNATSWNPDANDDVWTVDVSGSTVYAGGAFTGTNSIGGADRNHVAALDSSTGNATAWDPDMSALVRTIDASPGAVFAGGDFRTVETGPGAYSTAFLEAPTSLRAPAISGTPAPGHNLTCDQGDWTGAPALAIQWLRDGAPIAGATSAVFTVHAGDVDHALRCRVVATNVLGSKTSASAPVRVQAPPRNEAPPTIAGNATVGSTVTCTRGSWSGSTPLAYAYEWFRGGTPIAGASSRTYTVRAIDAGHGLRCRVTVTNRVGRAQKASAAVRAR